MQWAHGTINILLSGSMHIYAKGGGGGMFTSSASHLLTFTSYCNPFISVLVICLLLLRNSDTVEMDLVL